MHQGAWWTLGCTQHLVSIHIIKKKPMIIAMLLPFYARMAIINKSKSQKPMSDTIKTGWLSIEYVDKPIQICCLK